MRRHLWRIVRTLRVSAAARWRTVRQLRSQTRTVLSERRLRRFVEHPGAEPASDGAECAAGADDWLEAEVLRVIARHPEGVRALDIGNELGVDWRRVPAVAGRLVDDAMVEQIAHEFYPVQKAS